VSTGAGEAVQAAVVAALAGALDGAAVFDAAPVRASPPFAVVEEPAAADWSAADVDGRELRLTVTITDVGERPVRLRALMTAAERAVAGLSGAMGDWQVASVVLARSRIVRTGERWRGGVEWRVRVARPATIMGDG
jgi:hypothetical protein